MDTTSYILAPAYSLKYSTSEDTYTLVRDTGTSFTINDAIYDFLAQFEMPVIPSDLFKPDQTVELTFFSKMKDRGILIENNNTTSEIRQLTHQQKYTQGDQYKTFKIVKLISSNTYIETYLCTKETKQYILKTMHLPDHLNSTKVEKAKAAFHQEMLVNAHLPSTEYFVKPIDIDHSSPTIIYPKVEGMTLDKYLYRHHPSLTQKHNLLKQIILALSQLHKHHIIHGDLHHGNIMVTPEKKIVVLDFDLSSYKDVTSPNKGGYYPYLAPEQILPSNFNYHKGFIDYQTDVYQLGILAYYLTYERLPLHDKHWEVLHDLIKTGVIQYQETPELNFVNKLIQDCVNPNRQIRYENANKIKKHWSNSLH